MPGNVWYDLSRGLFHLFFPRLCVSCSSTLRTGERVLCLSCVVQLPETGYHDHAANDTVMRLAGRFPFRNATSYGYFTHDGLLQHLLHQLKYNNNREVGRYLGEKLAYGLKKTDWVAGIDMIVPVPLHRSRLLERGYNQSELIADGMAKVLDKPVVAHVLLRKRHTESQTKKTREERLNNMSDAFVVPDPAPVRGKHILLIDDVLTTGATLEACALTLLAIDGVSVSIATIGIAV